MGLRLGYPRDATGLAALTAKAAAACDTLWACASRAASSMLAGTVHSLPAAVAAVGVTKAGPESNKVPKTGKPGCSPSP